MDNQQWKILQFPYFLGLFLGDGCVNGYIVRVTGIDLDILEYAKREIDSKIDEVTNLYKSGKDDRYYTLSILSPFTRLLYQFKKVKYIPKFVFEYSMSDKKEFIAGLMDADGFISVHKPKKYNYSKFSIGFVSTILVNDFSKVLNSVGCKVGKITLKNNHKIKNWNKCYQLHIPIYSYLDAGLYFRCDRKQKRLDLYNETIRIPSTTTRRAPNNLG